MSMIYQYRIISIDINSEQVLNELGAEGYRVVPESLSEGAILLERVVFCGEAE